MNKDDAIILVKCSCYVMMIEKFESCASLATYFQSNHLAIMPDDFRKKTRTLELGLILIVIKENDFNSH